jgi:hypothetical protein
VNFDETYFPYFLADNMPTTTENPVQTDPGAAHPPRITSPP